jgi:hypothetical protein
MKNFFKLLCLIFLFTAQMAVASDYLDKEKSYKYINTKSQITASIANQAKAYKGGPCWHNRFNIRRLGKA